MIEGTGALDTSFSGTGIATTTIDNQSILSGSETIANVSLQADGKIVIAGYIENGSISRFAVARFCGVDRKYMYNTVNKHVLRNNT